MFTKFVFYFISICFQMIKKNKSIIKITVRHHQSTAIRQQQIDFYLGRRHHRTCQIMVAPTEVHHLTMATQTQWPWSMAIENFSILVWFAWCVETQAPANIMAYWRATAAQDFSNEVFEESLYTGKNSLTHKFISTQYYFKQFNIDEKDIGFDLYRSTFSKGYKITAAKYLHLVLHIYINLIFIALKITKSDNGILFW